MKGLVIGIIVAVVVIIIVLVLVLVVFKKKKTNPSTRKPTTGNPLTSSPPPNVIYDTFPVYGYNQFPYSLAWDGNNIKMTVVDTSGSTVTLPSFKLVRLGGTKKYVFLIGTVPAYPQVPNPGQIIGFGGTYQGWWFELSINSTVTTIEGWNLILTNGTIKNGTAAPNFKMTSVDYVPGDQNGYLILAKIVTPTTKPNYIPSEWFSSIDIGFLP